MALKETINKLTDLLLKITKDLTKAERGNKTAAQRVRTGTVRLEKLAKVYRKESILDGEEIPDYRLDICFDINKKISRKKVNFEVEEKAAFMSIREGLDPDDDYYKKECKKIRRAVQHHNINFE